MNSSLSALPSVNRLLENPIGWCDATANIVTGCDKVSEGCKNCYAQAGTRARVLRAQGIETWGPGGVRHPVAEFETKVRRLNKLCICDKCHSTHPVQRLQTFKNFPDGSKQVWACARFNRQETLVCAGQLRRIRLFADSNSDWLDTKWLIKGRADMLGELLQIIFRNQNIDFLLLTKRIDWFHLRFHDVIKLYGSASCNDDFVSWVENWRNGHPPSNAWLGVSVENQATADKRIPQLLNIPAKFRFVSAEPLLEPVDLLSAAFNGSDSFSAMEGINWVIIGGESGPHRRDCGVEAIANVARQCQASRVPVYVKQDCAHKPGQQGRLYDEIWSLKQFPFDCDQ